MGTIRLYQGDITQAQTDAIVNAANPSLTGGGGVDGAIHRAAGPELLAACLQIAPVGGVRCPVGEARMTSAGKLAAKYVIHAVGPRYRLDPQPPRLLASAWYTSLQLALAQACRSVTFPAISCGVYAYPPAEAAQVALSVCRQPAFAGLAIDICLFSEEMLQIWQHAAAESP
ncbi:macro domain-containing protein [Granulosicoccaceae sp. 1_MG-2023]|nr:macro domain-containing protein [Granulosicoccaceae sp. 1_MG-2023]